MKTINPTKIDETLFYQVKMRAVEERLPMRRFILKALKEAVNKKAETNKAAQSLKSNNTGV
jgi:hypothetical protein